MKFKFTQPLYIQHGTCYMKLNEWQERQDIKDFLMGNGTGNEKLDAGISRYLMSIGVYDRDGQLTKEGEILKQTGQYPGASEGKYSIWFAEDPILDSGIRILYYERENTRSGEFQGLGYPNNILIAAIERAKTTQSERLKVKLKNNRLAIVQHSNKSQTQVNLVYKYEINDQEAVDHYYLGELTRGDKKVYQLQQPNQVSKDPESIKDEERVWTDTLFSIIGNELNGIWEKEKYRLSLSVEQAKCLGGDIALKLFRLKQYTATTEQGQTIELEQIGLKPNSREEAIKWFETLLAIEARKVYLHQSDLDSIAELREEEAMAEYRQELLTPKAGDLAQKYHKDRVGYWHLMAPQDLKPGCKLQIAEPFCLEAKKAYTMEDIVSSLGIKPNARWVAYYDKYVCRPHQQSYISLLLNAVDADKSIVITNKVDMETTRNKSTYLKELSQTKSLDILDGRDVLDGRNVHDRYLILCDNRGELCLWSLTNSLSQFDKGDRKWSQVDISTPIISLQDLTITPISTKMQSQLITYLKNHVHVK